MLICMVMEHGVACMCVQHRVLDVNEVRGIKLKYKSSRSRRNQDEYVPHEFAHRNPCSSWAQFEQLSVVWISEGALLDIFERHHDRISQEKWKPKTEERRQVTKKRTLPPVAGYVFNKYKSVHNEYRLILELLTLAPRLHTIIFTDIMPEYATTQRDVLEAILLRRGNKEAPLAIHYNMKAWSGQITNFLLEFLSQMHASDRTVHTLCVSWSNVAGLISRHTFWPVKNLSIGSFNIAEGYENAIDNLFQAPVLQRLNIWCRQLIHAQMTYSNETRAIPVLHIEWKPDPLLLLLNRLNLWTLCHYSHPMRKTSILLMEIVYPHMDPDPRIPRKKGLELEVETIQILWTIYNTNDPVVIEFPPITQRILTVVYIGGFPDHFSLTADEISEALLVRTVIGPRIKMLFDWYVQQNEDESVSRWLAKLYVVWDMTQWSTDPGKTVAPVTALLRRLDANRFTAACIHWTHENCQLDEFFRGWITTNQLILLPSTPDTERHIRDSFLTIPLRPHVPYYEDNETVTDDQEYFYQRRRETMNVEG